MKNGKIWLILVKNLNRIPLGFCNLQKFRAKIGATFRKNYIFLDLGKEHPLLYAAGPHLCLFRTDMRSLRADKKRRTDT